MLLLVARTPCTHLWEQQCDMFYVAELKEAALLETMFYMF